jgi:hypothetical protein
MALIHLPDPANLIVGIIAANAESAAAARAALEANYGPVDEQSETIPFDFTDYYQPEMGERLIRTWLSFARLQPLDHLAEIKLATNAIEDTFRGFGVSIGGSDSGQRTAPRRVNLDPGFLTLHNLVLATTKDYSHRIYLGQGIFAEVTLIYEHGAFQSLRWTYRDYQSPTALGFLARARDRYIRKVAEQRK